MRFWAQDIKQQINGSSQVKFSCSIVLACSRFLLMTCSSLRNLTVVSGGQIWKYHITLQSILKSFLLFFQKILIKIVLVLHSYPRSWPACLYLYYIYIYNNCWESEDTWPYYIVYIPSLVILTEKLCRKVSYANGESDASNQKLQRCTSPPLL